MTFYFKSFHNIHTHKDQGVTAEIPFIICIPPIEGVGIPRGRKEYIGLISEWVGESVSLIFEQNGLFFRGGLCTGTLIFLILRGYILRESLNGGGVRLLNGMSQSQPLFEFSGVLLRTSQNKIEAILIQ